ncbi:MAG: RDD family protein [Mycobacterium sp.]|nr:RDD family protein [Mycobacterium sp.]
MSDDRTAGIVSRGVAAVIDLIVVGVLIGLIYWGLRLGELMFHPIVIRVPTLSFGYSTAATGIVSVLYLTACWAVSGSTVGSVVMGLRVTRLGGERLAPVRAMLRAGACVLFPVGLLWVTVDRRRRSLQDIVFRTKVVYAWH